MIAYSLSNDDRKSTVFSSRRNVVSDGAFLTDDGRLFYARVTWQSHWEGTVTECWTSSGRSKRYHQHGWVSRAQTTSSVDVRCPEKALSKVCRRCSMKTAVSQNAQPECDLLQNSQPMKLTEQWGYAFWPPRWENQTGGGSQDGLQQVLKLARDTSKNRVAVVHLADNQCTNQDQQGMMWQRSPHAPDLT